MYKFDLGSKSCSRCMRDQSRLNQITPVIGGPAWVSSVQKVHTTVVTCWCCYILLFFCIKVREERGLFSGD